MAFEAHVWEDATEQLAEIQTHSTITCPHCGMGKTEEMPTDACRFFYECEGRGELLRPNKGDRCVFCSFGTVPCPPIQEKRLAEGRA